MSQQSRTLKRRPAAKQLSAPAEVEARLKRIEEAVEHLGRATGLAPTIHSILNPSEDTDG